MNARQIGSILFAIGGLFDAMIGALTPFVTHADVASGLVPTEP